MRREVARSIHSCVFFAGGTAQDGNEPHKRGSLPPGGLSLEGLDALGEAFEDSFRVPGVIVQGGVKIAYVAAGPHAECRPDC